jgi:hypothetical protein
MIKFFLFLFLATLCNLGFTQNHVKWNAYLSENKREIILKVTIEKGWHLYSASTPENAGPVPVEILLKKNKKYKQIGKAKEISASKFIYDANFGSNVAIIENEYVASIPIKIKNNCTVSGAVYYMICDDTMCLPPISVDFNVIIK